MNSPFFQKFMQICETSDYIVLQNIGKMLHNSHIPIAKHCGRKDVNDVTNF